MKLSDDHVEGVVGQVTDALASASAPAVTAYELAKQVFIRLDSASGLSPNPIYRSILRSLLKSHLLTAIPHVTPNAYLLFGRSNASAADIVCSLDPFSFVSHFSAMEHHGLTDRFPKILYMTRPPIAEWRKQALVKSTKDLGSRMHIYEAAGLPKLVPPKILRISHTVVQFSERSQLGAFRLVSGSSIRVATIGRVFLDMLRAPGLCGGIQHVVDIYRREAKRYLKLIVDEVDRHGQPIDKVRAGYILSEVCKLDSPEFDRWLTFAQRGGSRKLDVEGEYVSDYSERWKLSINVPSLAGPEGNDE